MQLILSHTSAAALPKLVTYFNFGVRQVHCDFLKLAVRDEENGWCYTSSTAQGGGGSFKNRRPIGEVGCCESRMAERIH